MMPTFNKKTGKNEYFIRARPPDAGNITYQVSTGAKQLLINLGYSDGDDLPWGLVKPLRIAGLLHTKGEGPNPTVDSEDIPNLDSGELQRATSDEKRAVLEYLETHSGIPEPTFNEIKEYLGADYKQESTFYERCKSVIASKFEESDWTLVDASVKPTNVGFEISIRIDEDTDSTASTGGIISLEDLDNSSSDSSIQHRILIVDDTNIVDEADKGIDEWVVVDEENITWKERAKVKKSKATILLVLAELSDKLDFTLGDPEDSFAYFGPGE